MKVDNGKEQKNEMRRNNCTRDEMNCLMIQMKLNGMKENSVADDYKSGRLMMNCVVKVGA